MRPRWLKKVKTDDEDRRMNGSRISSATMPNVPDSPIAIDAEELARLKELERGVIDMTEMLKESFWDTSEGSGLSGLAGRLQSEITRLWLDTEALGEELRRANNNSTQV